MRSTSSQQQGKWEWKYQRECITNDETLSLLQAYWDCTEQRDFIWSNQTYTMDIFLHYRKHWMCGELWDSIEDSLTYMVVIFSVLEAALKV